MVHLLAGAKTTVGFFSCRALLPGTSLHAAFDVTIPTIVHHPAPKLTTSSLNMDLENSNRLACASRMSRDYFTFRELIFPGLKYEMNLKRVMHSTRSEHQDIDIIETCFGKTLVTDGLTQSSEFDEFVYHETLVHPAMIKFASEGKGPESVFIGGGGELATMREVLRHKSVKRVVMVDLDQKIVELCKEYLPEWGGEKVASEPRATLVFGDAHEYILNTEEVFDVIIMDISDPVEAGPGIALYTKEFYEFALTKLSRGGVFVTQAGMASVVPSITANSNLEDAMCFAPIRNTLASVFDVAMPYKVNIPSFGTDWGFVMAFNSDDPAGSSNSWRLPSVQMIDNLLDQQLSEGSASLQHYDGITHCHLFAVTKSFRKYLETDKRIMTKENPIYMFG